MIRELLPGDGGSYILFLEPVRPGWIEVGRLGRYTIPAGLYAYIGSAHGPGGLRARIMRHLGPSPKVHWHVDTLIRSTRVIAAGWAAQPERMECAWVQALLRLPEATAPIRRFGASDCSNGCPAHLLFFGKMERQIFRSALFEEIHRRLSGISPGFRFHYYPRPVDQIPRPPEPGDG